MYVSASLFQKKIKMYVIVCEKRKPRNKHTPGVDGDFKTSSISGLLKVWLSGDARGESASAKVFENKRCWD